MSNRKKSLEAMLEALIKNDSEKAAEHLHNYITAKTREIMIGEGDDDSDDDDKEEKSDDDSGSDEKEEKSDDDDSGSDEKEEKSDDDDDDGDSDDDDDDDKDDDDGKPAFLKKKEDVKESKKGFTEAPPGRGSQPMKGLGKGNKFSKYQNPKGTMDEKIKGDSLKGKGSAKGKAFTEKPKSPPQYKDGVDHKAGEIKNRAKAG